MRYLILSTAFFLFNFSLNYRLALHWIVFYVQNFALMFYLMFTFYVLCDKMILGCR